MIRVPNWSPEQLNQGFNNILKPSENPYDDVFYQNTPSLRLLMIVLDRVLDTLKDLEAEAQNVVELIENGKIPYEPTPTKLPQAPLKVTEAEAEDLEFTAAIQLEEEEIVGEKEEEEEQDE